MNRYFLASLSLLCITAIIGCAPSHPSGTISIDSQASNPRRLSTSFGYGSYGVEAGDTSLVLSTVPIQKLQSGDFTEAQIIHIQLMWIPKAGSTPVSKDSTNLVIRYIVLIDGEAGIYGGGGFAWPRGTVGKTGLGLDVTGSNLALLHSTTGFKDLLSPAALRGWVGAPLNPELMSRFQNTTSQIVTDRLGKPMWIQNDHPAGKMNDEAIESIIRAAGLLGTGTSPG